MPTARVTIAGTTPYIQSRPHLTPRLKKETSEAYSERTWQELIHTDKDGIVVIPPMTFKRALEYSTRVRMMIPPVNCKSTYTRHFKSGLIVLDPPSLNVHKDDVTPISISKCYGHGNRFNTFYPAFSNWMTQVVFTILSPVITQEILLYYLMVAGKIAGIGKFRPESGGTNGRFRIESSEWIDDDVTSGGKDS